MKRSILKITVLLLLVGLNWTGLSAIGQTIAYFNDTENSNANLFQATIFDFSVTNRHIENFIGMEALSEIESVSVVMKTTGSLDVQYEVNAEKMSGNDDFCNALQIELEHNGVEKHDGSLVSVSVPATIHLGTWEFELDLPVSANNVLHGVECNVDLVFKGWRSDVVNFEDSGFTDEERIELRLTSRMIVLNEFLPNPDGVAYEYDFGNDDDTMPKGEWVELYNNSNTSHDLAGWYIWDASNDNSNKIYITNLNTQPTTTIISGKSWLVVYMNKEVFDNGGDAVKLFNENNELIDSYTYTDSDYCELEPTPEDENSTSASGSCGGVPGNKSYARIPDGIGSWVDPIPTPGLPNRLSWEEIGLEEIAIENTNTIIDIATENTTDITENTLPELIATTTGITTTTDTITLDANVTDAATGTTNAATSTTIATTTDAIGETVTTTDNTITTDNAITTDNTITTDDATTTEEVSIIEEINEIIDGVIDEIIEEIIPDELVDEEIPIEDTQVIDETATIEEVPTTEESVIEEVSVIEEQPVIAPPENNLVEQAPPADNSSGSGDGGSGDDGSSDTGSSDTGVSGDDALNE